MHEQQENEQLAPNKPIDILPEGFLMRQIDTDDYNKGYMELLSQLTTTGTVSLMEFISQLNKMRSMAGMYHIYVIEDIKKSRIVATATLVVELHFIHQCGTRGRIEDVVVDKEVRGRSFGKLLSKHLVLLAKDLGIYKLSLECIDDLVPFYKSLDFQLDKNKFMVQRFKD